MLNRIFIWIFFSVLVALTPLVFQTIFFSINGNSYDLFDLVGQGELLLISTALCATSIGELFNNYSHGYYLNTLKIISSGLTLLILLISAFAFSVISSLDILHQNNINKEIIVSLSFYIFSFSVIVSTSCISISGFRHE